MISVAGSDTRRSYAIGVVVYHADETLLSRLKMALELGYQLYVFDNSPARGDVREFLAVSDRGRYLTCGKNVGLGFGIASVCAHAYFDSFPALLFFDQDTIFNGDTLRYIEEFFCSNHSLVPEYSVIVFNSKKIHEQAVNRFAIKDVLLVISSGSLFFLENAKKINWHNEKYFVDCVDYEFCLRSSNNGLKVGECSMTPGFDHVSEQPDVKCRIWGKDRMLRRYPFSRVADTVFASIRLFFSAAFSLNLPYAAAIIRSLGIYLHWQLMARLLCIGDFKEWTTK